MERRTPACRNADIYEGMESYLSLASPTPKQQSILGHLAALPFSTSQLPSHEKLAEKGKSEVGEGSLNVKWISICQAMTKFSSEVLSDEMGIESDENQINQNNRLSVMKTVHKDLPESKQWPMLLKNRFKLGQHLAIIRQPNVNTCWWRLKCMARQRPLYLDAMVV